MKIEIASLALAVTWFAEYLPYQIDHSKKVITVKFTFIPTLSFPFPQPFLGLGQPVFIVFKAISAALMSWYAIGEAVTAG